jgi:energy-coupling factor transporter ATP-binding protein EcfA2
MWGPPGSGKTTFLAALSIALRQQSDGWNVMAANASSEKILVDMTGALNGRHAFPPATRIIDDFHWVLNRRVETTVRKGWFGRETRYERESIGLDLVDASGEIAGSAQHGRPNRENLMKRLKDSRGIVYMYDPIRESERGDADDHTFGMCAQLCRELSEEAALDFDGTLPHFVAVCVTKFDELRVYETARQLGLLAFDDDDPGFPRVHSEDARELLAALCEVSASQNGAMVLHTLEQYFRPERIRYFVTSSVGFRVDPGTGRFDPRDPQNLLPDRQATASNRVRGPVRPINVVEPLLWLIRQVAAVSPPEAQP